MLYQLEFSDVIHNFLSNEEYLKGFLSALGYPEQEFTVKGRLFKDDEFVSWVQRSPTIDGFVISTNGMEIYFISPSKNYIGFWGHRNFFTWRLAKRHDNKNDGITRCVINYMYRSESNKTEEFDIIKNFHILNLYEGKIPEELKQWLQAIYKEL